MEKSHAYRLIDSAQVKEILSPIGDIQPINEAQTRPLTKLETAELQREAWQKVVARGLWVLLSEFPTIGFES